MKVNCIKKNLEQDQIGFAEKVDEKIALLEKKKKNIDELKVITIYEKNPKREKENFRVEVAMFSNDKTVAVNGVANSQVKAFELAIEKIQAIIRKEHDSKIVTKKHH